MLLLNVSLHYAHFSFAHIIYVRYAFFILEEVNYRCFLLNFYFHRYATYVRTKFMVFSRILRTYDKSVITCQYLSKNSSKNVEFCSFNYFVTCYKYDIIKLVCIISEEKMNKMSKKMEKKYIPLATFFQSATQNEVTLTFESLENIMGQALPNAAYLNMSWWKKTKPPLTHFLAWTNADYYVVDVKLGSSITFSRLNPFEHSEADEHKSTNAFVIRSIETEDARPYINLLEEIYNETDYLPYASETRQLTVQGVRKMMGEWRKAKNSTVLLCIFNGQFAGYLALTGDNASRRQHVAHIEIGVKKSFKKQGVATSLLQTAEQWALDRNITRLELSVCSQNEASAQFFAKHNFIVEGTRHQSMFINDTFVDELFMSKLLK